MTRRPGDQEPEPSGGRAAERLRELVEQRYPGGLAPAGAEREEPEGSTDDESVGDQRPEDHP